MRVRRNPGRIASATLLLALVILGGCGPRRVSEGWQGSGRPWFDAQILSGFAPDGRPLATLVVNVPHRNLVFFAAGEGYDSDYRVRAVQKSGRAALDAQEWVGSVHVDSYAETRSQSVVEKTVQLELVDAGDAGPQSIVVTLSVEGTQRRSSLTLEYVPAKMNAGGVSIAEAGFYLLRGGQPLPESGALRLTENLVPDAQMFARAPSPVFDLSTGEPWLWVRVFDLRATPRESLELQLRGLRQTQWWGDELRVHGDAVESSFLVRIPAAALVFGKNDFSIELEGAAARPVQLTNLGLDLKDKRSWEANLAHIDALAISDEMDHMRAAKPEERAAEWKRFWDRRDPTPETPENERLDEHYRRVSYARRQLRDGVREGAISDRGRVYIQHGPPDSIEDVASRSDLLTSWQLWRYSRLGIVYYFRLVHGGDYRLAWSEGY